MFLNDIRQLRTGTRELRNFGLLVGAVFAAIGLFLWIKGKPVFPWLLTPGVLLIAFGLVLPGSLKFVYIAWMSLAMVLGFIVSHVILTLFFYLVITPIGLAARVAGKDFLRLKLEPNAQTYWIPRERKAARTQAEYEQQF